MSEVFESVFGSINAFVYRCRNDENYTMEYLAGAVEPLTGYADGDILGNNVVSYVGMVVQEEVECMFAEVDAAIEAGESWDIFYHLNCKDGTVLPVRERGRAVYESGELAYLEGLVVGAQAEDFLTKEIAAHLEESRMANGEIGKYAKRITSSLTNLSMLSINARIEAARSGEAGRGFALVADEMKLLAADNTKWARLIEDKLDSLAQ